MRSRAATSAIDEYRHDADVGIPQPGLDVQPYDVPRLVQAASTVLVHRIRPVSADHDQDDAALGEALLEDVDEVLPDFDRVDVDEELFRAEGTGEAVVQAPGERGLGLTG